LEVPEVVTYSSPLRDGGGQIVLGKYGVWEGVSEFEKGRNLRAIPSLEVRLLGERKLIFALNGKVKWVKPQENQGGARNLVDLEVLVAHVK